MAMNWISKTGYIVLRGLECVITIEPRPSYCDRGNFIAKIDARGELALDFDHQDGWPRYYFDLERAKAECEAWVRKRRQEAPPSITCPVCNFVSYNPHDIANQYCGACHVFHGDLLPTASNVSDV